MSENNDKAISMMKEALKPQFAQAATPLPAPGSEDEQLWEDMKGIVKKIGTHGLDRLLKTGVLDPSEIFAAPSPVRVNPLDPKGAEWSWGKKAWEDARDEIVKRGDAWVMGRGGALGPNYGGIYSLWKDEFEKEFGFRPTRTKEQSMTKAMEKAMREAVAKVVKVIGTVDPKVMADIQQKGK